MTRETPPQSHVPFGKRVKGLAGNVLGEIVVASPSSSFEASVLSFVTGQQKIREGLNAPPLSCIVDYFGRDSARVRIANPDGTETSYFIRGSEITPEGNFPIEGGKFK